MGMQIKLIYFVYEPKNTLYYLHKVQLYYVIVLMGLAWASYLSCFLALIRTVKSYQHLKADKNFLENYKNIEPKLINSYRTRFFNPIYINLCC